MVGKVYLITISSLAVSPSFAATKAEATLHRNTGPHSPYPLSCGWIKHTVRMRKSFPSWRLIGWRPNNQRINKIHRAKEWSSLLKGVRRPLGPAARAVFSEPADAVAADPERAQVPELLDLGRQHLDVVVRQPELLQPGQVPNLFRRGAIYIFSRWGARYWTGCFTLGVRETVRPRGWAGEFDPSREEPREKKKQTETKNENEEREKKE